MQYLQTWGGSGGFYGGKEHPATDFGSYIRDAYMANGIVFACSLARMALFTEATFQWRNFQDGGLFGNAGLGMLEEPWPNGTTGDMLARAEQDVSLAGNFYLRVYDGRVERLRPDWVTIVAEPQGRGLAPDVVGYQYDPGGNLGAGTFVPAAEMVHWAPIPDPDAAYRGMSWLTPVAREVLTDRQMTRHKQRFFDNAATPNLLITYDSQLSPESKDRIREQLAAKHESVENAYKTLVLDAGADATVVGNSLEQMSFSATQAAGENRICVASGVPPIVVGIQSGLNAATYSNYGQAMRRFADLWARPQWRSIAAALDRILPTPAGAQLWYDDRDIPALQQDAQDEADIVYTKARTADTLIRAGYEPEAVAAAVESGDLTMLTHSGNIPTTLYPEGIEEGDSESSNGSKPNPAASALGALGGRPKGT